MDTGTMTWAEWKFRVEGHDDLLCILVEIMEDPDDWVVDRARDVAMKGVQSAVPGASVEEVWFKIHDPNNLPNYIALATADEGVGA